MVGASTYENSLFPPVAELLRMAVHKRIRARQTAWFGSYGWQGGAQRNVEKLFDALKWELVESFEFCGKPTEAELSRGVELGARFAQAVGAEGLSTSN